MGLYWYYFVFVSMFLLEMSEGGYYVMLFLYMEGVFMFIIENMDMECMGSNNFNLGEYEYYMVLENDFCCCVVFFVSFCKDEVMFGMFWDLKLGLEWFVMFVLKYCLMKFC